MTALSTLALVALFSAPGDNTRSAPALAAGDSVLVEFSSQRCTYCQAMQPIMTQLSQQGCPLQVIDVDQHQDLARQFRITGVPTFVAQGRGVVGAQPYEVLERLVVLAGAQRRNTPAT